MPNRLPMSSNPLRWLQWLSLVWAVAAGPNLAITAEPGDWQRLRDQMVDLDLVPSGIHNARVLASLRQTMRHRFVPLPERPRAYFDMALPIGDDQTISPPFIVALMTQKLDPQPTDRVLEIGTGSGYQAAVLANLVREVYTIEIRPALGERAAQSLQQLGYTNVSTRVGDGYAGWPEMAPFDKIIVTCSPEKVPQPLVEQLRDHGLMVIPLGERFQQTLYVMRKSGQKLVPESIEPTFFVPMTGAADEERQSVAGMSEPRIINGDFEQSLPKDNRPANWFYVRQAQLEVESGRGQVLHLTNATPGRTSQALQALGMLGSQIASVDVSLAVRGRQLKAGADKTQQPRLLVTFFNDHKQPVGQGSVGPWTGDVRWKRQSARLAVPPESAFAIVAVGLLGGTGELWVDDVQLAVHAPRATVARQSR